MANLIDNIGLPQIWVPVGQGYFNPENAITDNSGRPIKSSLHSGYVDSKGNVFYSNGWQVVKLGGGFSGYRDSSGKTFNTANIPASEKASPYTIDVTPKTNASGQTVYKIPDFFGPGGYFANASGQIALSPEATEKDKQMFEVRRESNSPTGYVKGGSARDGSGTPVMPDGSEWKGQSLLTTASDPQKAAQLLQQIQQEYVNQSFVPGLGVGGSQAEKVNALQNEFTSLFPDFNVASGVLNSGYKQQQTAIDKYFEEQKNANNAMTGGGSGLSIGNILKTVGDLTVKVGPAIAGVALAAHGIPALLPSIAPAAAGGAGAAAAGSGLSAAELLAVGGFVPTAGSAASFAVPSLLGSAALTSGLSAPELLAVGGFAPSVGSGASFAAPGIATGTGLLSGYTGATKGLLLPEMISGTVGSLSGAGSASGIAATQAAAGLGIASGSALPAAGMAVGGLPSTVGQLSAALPAPGSVGGAGAMSGQLAPGTILGSGLPGGGSIGASYALGANNLPATGLLGQPIPASSIGFGDIPSTVTAGLNISPSDILKAAELGAQVLGGQPQQPAAPAARPQSIIPRGQVDYSGILNLLQTRSPQRNIYSLLG